MAPTKKHTNFCGQKLRASPKIGFPNNLPADLVGLALEEEALPGSSQTAPSTNRVGPRPHQNLSICGWVFPQLPS